MVLKKIFLFALLVTISIADAQVKHSPVVYHHYGFYENKGQLIDQNYKPNTNVKYLLCHPGFNVQLRKTGFSYDTYSDTPDTALPPKTFGVNPKIKFHPRFTRHYQRVDIELSGCNPTPEIVPTNKSETYYNYFTTGTPREGVTNVHYYGSVLYKSIYPHIDLEFFAEDTNKGMEYNFILHPGANVSSIKLLYKGMKDIKLEENQLDMDVSAGKFTENIPSSYFKETNQQVKAKYISLGNNIFSFSLPERTIINKDLIIDPTTLCLVWSTYYGGALDDYANGIALDSIDNIYFGGSTSSTNNMATTGAYQTSYGGAHNDGFLAKLDSNWL